MKKILILSANPKNTDKLRLDEEVREIEEGLARARKRDLFEVISKWALRPDDLRRALLDYEPQIVHFSGHGAGKEGLALEDESGKAKLVSTEALASLFELCMSHVECVVLNACYSGVQAEAIVQHIAAVVGMSEAIGDEAAIQFAIGFYDAIGAGRSIQDSYKFGCNAIQLVGIPEQFKPVLHLNPELTTSQAIYSKSQTPMSTDPNSRSQLIRTLNSLPPQQFSELLYALNPPAGVIPPMTAPQGDRTYALLSWAEGSTGCGLAEVQQALESLLNPR